MGVYHQRQDDMEGVGMSDVVKLCKDCRHMNMTRFGAVCALTDHVHGWGCWATSQGCAGWRFLEHGCGSDARHFEPIPPRQEKRSWWRFWA